MTRIEVPVRRLPHAHDLPLPAYATAGAAGLDVLAALPVDQVVAPGVRALELYARAQERGISVGAGNIFATNDAFQHCIRLNYSYPWSAEVEAAVRTLGLLAGELAVNCTPRQKANL